MNSIFWLLYSFFKIGIFGFGGGLAILPMIFQAVEENADMNSSQFANLVGIAQITPGPIAINAATFVGFNEAGVFGALAATVAVSLPGFVFVLIALHYLEKFKSSPVKEGLVMGIRPVTVGLIFTACALLCDGLLYNTELDEKSIIAGLIFVISAIAAGKFKINPIVLICTMGIAGALVYGNIS